MMNRFYLHRSRILTSRRSKSDDSVRGDAASERNDGNDSEDADAKNYVCIKCRSKMANEAFTTCDHLPAYCSECIANLRKCPFCEAKANALRAAQP